MATKAERREHIATAVLAALVRADGKYDEARHPMIAVGAANALLAAFDQEAAKEKPTPARRATPPATRPRRKILDDVD